MDESFRGKVTVKVLDPTTLMSYHAIELETDYTE